MNYYYSLFDTIARYIIEFIVIKGFKMLRTRPNQFTISCLISGKDSRKSNGMRIATYASGVTCS